MLLARDLKDVIKQVASEEEYRRQHPVFWELVILTRFLPLLFYLGH